MRRLALTISFALALTTGSLAAQDWAPIRNTWVPLAGGPSSPASSINSFSLNLPVEFNVAGVPCLTGDCVISGTWVSQSANKVLASPDNASGIFSARSLAPRDLGSNGTDGQCITQASATTFGRSNCSGSSAPTGTGFAFVTSGAYDAASKGAADAASFLGIETQYIYCRDEMTGASGECSSAQSSGTNSSASSNLNDPGSADGGTSKPFGVKILTTGDTTTGRAAQIMSNSTDNGIGYCTAGAGEYYAAVALEDLSAVAQEYDIWIGLLREISTQPTYGIYFKYDRDGTSTNWYACSANASSRTCTDTSVAVAEDTWVKFRITWDSTCANATMYINGSSVATKNATMPTAGITPGVAMLKSAGTTARRAFVDYQVYYQKLTNAR